MDLEELKTRIVWFLMTFWCIDLGQLMSNLSIYNIWKQKYSTIKHFSVTCLSGSSFAMVGGGHPVRCMV